MRILVFGAGGVGLGLGSFLQAGGARVGFVARPATVAALRARGLRRTGCFGEHRAPAGSVAAAERVADLHGDGPPDYVLVTVKSYDTEAAAEALHAARGGLGTAPFILCQNGWGNAERFARRLARERVWNARVITGFRRPAPGEVEVTVHAEPVRVGSLFGAAPARVAPLCEALAKGGLPAEASDRIAADLWAKLLYNAALNPACALRGCSYGELAASEDGRRLIAEVAHEVFAVMRAAGHATHWPDAEAWLGDFYARLLPPTAAHEPSMLQDLRAGRRTEIDALCGAIVRLGQQHRIPTPRNTHLTTAIQSRLKQCPRGRGSRG